MLRHLLHMLLWGMMALLFTVAACQRSTSVNAELDEREVALVSLARSQHTLADLALDRGDVETATNELWIIIEQVKQIDLPTSIVYEVGLDAYIRIVRIHYERGDLVKAITTAEQGLSWSQDAEPSIFRGHLYQLLGDVLKASGDPHGAIEAHTQAVEIFKSLLDRVRNE